MARRPLYLAIVSTFFVGCVATEPVLHAANTAAQGSTELAGVSGLTGATGATGARGATGSTGAQGPLAGGAGWSLFREYSFNAYDNAIQRADSNTAREVASYLAQNPSYRIGIDGMDDRRVSNVRSALIDAGVPEFKIQTGAFDNPQLRRDSRVAVLVSSL